MTHRIFVRFSDLITQDRISHWSRRRCSRSSTCRGVEDYIADREQTTGPGWQL